MSCIEISELWNNITKKTSSASVLSYIRNNADKLDTQDALTLLEHKYIPYFICEIIDERDNNNVYLRHLHNITESYNNLAACKSNIKRKKLLI